MADSSEESPDLMGVLREVTLRIGRAFFVEYLPAQAKEDFYETPNLPWVRKVLSLPIGSVAWGFNFFGGEEDAPFCLPIFQVEAVIGKT